jgi:exosortase C (VPDSG-CTERM-specific)
MESQVNVARSFHKRRAAAWATWRELPRPQRLRIAGMVGYVGLLAVLFLQPLARLALYATQNGLASHVVLVPFISAYLFLNDRRRPAADYGGSLTGTFIASAAGFAALAAVSVFGGTLSANDYLALTTAAFVSFVIAGGFLVLGASWMAGSAFPFAFLVFMIPLPDAAAYWLERASVVGSSYAAGALFHLTGTPILRDSNLLTLPGITLSVAQECSGIRSSLVLFITSLLASHVLLESTWRKIVLSIFVIPLGILRNGFRIMVIGLLCVHMGPQMIDSPIHHRGGPLFFLLSLVPLFMLLVWFRRQEHRRRTVRPALR